MVGETVFAEVTIRDPEKCQVASESDPSITIRSVSRTAFANDAGFITEELEVDDETSGDNLTAEPVDEPNGVFRLQRPADQGCACELVEYHGCPVRQVNAKDGRLSLTFYAEDLATIRNVVADLKDGSDGVRLERLYRTDNESSCDFVYIDRELFTERQREVLRVAHDMGYFAHPKGANAGEVAASLGIATTTFTEHLSTAQTKLLDNLLRR